MIKLISSSVLAILYVLLHRTLNILDNMLHQAPSIVKHKVPLSGLLLAMESEYVREFCAGVRD